MNEDLVLEFIIDWFNMNEKILLFIFVLYQEGPKI